MLASFDVSFFTSFNVIRLKSRLGPEADVYPLRLWAFCAIHAPDGILVGCNPEELEIILNWSGEFEKLFNALLETGFIEVEKGGVKVLLRSK